MSAKQAETSQDSIWWEEMMAMTYDYGTILYRAALAFPASEIDNYAALAEALWAHEQRL